MCGFDKRKKNIKFLKKIFANRNRISFLHFLKRQQKKKPLRPSFFEKGKYRLENENEFIFKKKKKKKKKRKEKK